MRIKLAIAIANAKGSAVDFSDACTARGGFLQFLLSLHCKETPLVGKTDLHWWLITLPFKNSGAFHCQVSWYLNLSLTFGIHSGIWKKRWGKWVRNLESVSARAVETSCSIDVETRLVTKLRKQIAELEAADDQILGYVIPILDESRISALNFFPLLSPIL